MTGYKKDLLLNNVKSAIITPKGLGDGKLRKNAND